eukprot:CAMPEP_0185267008 /NCGR_PEP_ID=MMETSP1359-20130426/33097_1 /TAXON_ID=552665 /ORGANISM="Bigelowiella longifila, Strain CCMP242" /LENGTH=99 /DNA_ID=CAMNT_0027857163 /DNA_START=222 /DNA_END=520 /DNA_ORIENTATION=+
MELKGVNKLKEVKNTDKIDLEEGKRIPDAVLKRLVKSIKKAKKLPCVQDEKSATWNAMEAGIILNDDVKDYFPISQAILNEKEETLSALGEHKIPGAGY